MTMELTQILKELMQAAKLLAIEPTEDNSKRSALAAQFLKEEIHNLEDGDVLTAMKEYIKGKGTHIEHYGRVTAEWAYKVVSYYMLFKPSPEPVPEKTLPKFTPEEREVNNQRSFEEAKENFRKDRRLRNTYVLLHDWMAEKGYIHGDLWNTQGVRLPAYESIRRELLPHGDISEIISKGMIDEIGPKRVKERAQLSVMNHYFEKEFKKELEKVKPEE